MPSTPHVERHFTATEAVRDVVIGMSDGLTVPFALAAGLSAAVTSSSLIVTAGLAEVAAGAIAMGLGGYLAAKTDIEHFDAEVARELREIAEVPHREVAEVESVMRGFGLEGEPLERVVAAITADRDRWVEFMMRFELGIERPDPRRAFTSALTIGGAYIVGGLVPLVPYMLVPAVPDAMVWSVISTGVALLAFGAIKGRFTGMNLVRSAIQTLVVGGLAAGAAFGLAHAFA
ncbi:MAG: iron transporter [Proteobacteria bacterium]|jgi:VIT1/CCC1 family predicted Fe2+/Mn2+ transporter|nr:iron transporter [Pseudomonadota bacterium]NCV21766.1 iron transporter [Chloroflexota bacterium]NBQ61706.1 iron transporter [Pseudomonadota bacterium]NBT02096.1 iron transporter [Pseudomonadota bacterium]NBT17456.1 iron transporter [Pseudomonadota bacterium]